MDVEYDFSIVNDNDIDAILATLDKDIALRAINGIAPRTLRLFPRFDNHDVENQDIERAAWAWLKKNAKTNGAIANYLRDHNYQFPTEINEEGFNFKALILSTAGQTVETVQAKMQTWMNTYRQNPQENQKSSKIFILPIAGVLLCLWYIASEQGQIFKQGEEQLKSLHLSVRNTLQNAWNISTISDSMESQYAEFASIAKYTIVDVEDDKIQVSMSHTDANEIYKTFTAECGPALTNNMQIQIADVQPAGESSSISVPMIQNNMNIGWGLQESNNNRINDAIANLDKFFLESIIPFFIKIRDMEVQWKHVKPYGERRYTKTAPVLFRVWLNALNGYQRKIVTEIFQMQKVNLTISQGNTLTINDLTDAICTWQTIVQQNTYTIMNAEIDDIQKIQVRTLADANSPSTQLILLIVNDILPKTVMLSQNEKFVQFVQSLSPMLGLSLTFWGSIHVNKMKLITDALPMLGMTATAAAAAYTTGNTALLIGAGESLRDYATKNIKDLGSFVWSGIATAFPGTLTPQPHTKETFEKFARDMLESIEAERKSVEALCGTPTRTNSDSRRVVLQPSRGYLPDRFTKIEFVQGEHSETQSMVKIIINDVQRTEIPRLWNGRYESMTNENYTRGVGHHVILWPYEDESYMNFDKDFSDVDLSVMVNLFLDVKEIVESPYVKEMIPEDQAINHQVYISVAMTAILFKYMHSKFKVEQF